MFAYQGTNAFTLDAQNVLIEKTLISGYDYVTNIEYPFSAVWNDCTFKNIKNDFRGPVGASIPNSTFAWKNCVFDNVASFENYNNSKRYKINNKDPVYLNNSDKLLENN